MLSALLLAAVVDLSSELKTAAEAAHVPAMQATVVRAEGIIAHGSYGAAIGEAFHIGSCTKPFTATLAAMLVEQKKLTWETRIVDIFPEWKSVIRPDYADVTLADLLSHEAGLPEFGEEDEFAHIPDFKGDSSARLRQFARYALSQPPVVKPRTATKYSNAGYDVAAAMIERVSGRSWESLLRTRIFQPLGLTTAGIGWPAKVWGHEWDGTRLVAVDPHGQYQLPDYIRASGDLHMSSDDLALFLRAHLRALRGERTLISPATAALMHTKRLKSGLGFGVNNEVKLAPLSTHSGSADTFYTVIAIAPKFNVAAVVQTNAAGESAQKAVGRILMEFLGQYAQ